MVRLCRRGGEVERGDLGGVEGKAVDQAFEFFDFPRFFHSYSHSPFPILDFSIFHFHSASAAASIPILRPGVDAMMTLNISWITL